MTLDLSFAQKLEDGRVIVDPAKAYPAYIAMLGGQPTQYWLEVARMCFTEDLTQVFGTPLHLVILKNDDFRLARFPRGDGPEKGAAAWRLHYNRLQAKRRLAG